MSEKNWTGVIGLMSGTSLDGLDCCYAEFSTDNGTYSFRNLVTKTYPYEPGWQEKLKNAFYLEKNELEILHLQFGEFLADKVIRFIADSGLNGKVSLIASHGHTVYHQPANKITVQIGCGETLNRLTGINVINDFRIKDVLLGGQGAPLVPVGDHYLFSDFGACLNLGGFSNISLMLNKQRIAFDIAPCNLPLNEICRQKMNCDFDRDGTIAANGKCIVSLFDQLNNLKYYKQSPPKSLGYEWLIEEFNTILKKFDTENPADLIRTITDHVAFQILEALKIYSVKNVLVTGGGAYNKHLINQLKKGNAQIILPDARIIEFKEALIFGFLGYLNFNNSINTFKSVTGAKEDSTGGIRHFSHQQ